MEREGRKGGREGIGDGECVKQHMQFTAVEFCWAKELLPTCHCACGEHIYIIKKSYPQQCYEIYNS